MRQSQVTITWLSRASHICKYVTVTCDCLMVSYGRVSHVWPHDCHKTFTVRLPRMHNFTMRLNVKWPRMRSGGCSAIRMMRRMSENKQTNKKPKWGAQFMGTQHECVTRKQERHRTWRGTPFCVFYVFSWRVHSVVVHTNYASPTSLPAKLLKWGQRHVGLVAAITGKQASQCDACFTQP